MATTAATFSTKNPEIVNSSSGLVVSIPILNTGDIDAFDVLIREISLGSVRPIEPKLPFLLGDLPKDSVVSAGITFPNNSFSVGGKYLLTIKGTSSSQSILTGFTLNRFITIPQITAPPFPVLPARLASSVDPLAGKWSFTAFNDCPSGSALFINAVSIDIGAPFVVTETPPGWAVETDNYAYVMWFSTDESLPYLNHIAPGASRNGFQIQSNTTISLAKAFVMTSWNHSSNQNDLSALGTVLTPALS